VKSVDVIEKKGGKPFIIGNGGQEICRRVGGGGGEIGEKRTPTRALFHLEQLDRRGGLKEGVEDEGGGLGINLPKNEGRPYG